MRAWRWRPGMTKAMGAAQICLLNCGFPRLTNEFRHRRERLMKVNCSHRLTQCEARRFSEFVDMVAGHNADRTNFRRFCTNSCSFEVFRLMPRGLCCLVWEPHCLIVSTILRTMGRGAASWKALANQESHNCQFATFPLIVSIGSIGART